MNTYKFTVINHISDKKRFIKINALSFENAAKQASYEINYTSEDIIKGVLIS